MNKERYPYSGSKEEIRLSKSARKHIRLKKQEKDFDGAEEFRKKELEKKRAQQRRELEKLEKRLEEESDPYKIAEIRFTTPWLKEKLGNITGHERKQDIEKIITNLEPDIFRKFVMGENGNGKTKAREIIDEISPEDKSLNELRELEIKLMGEKYLSPEEALEIKFTHIWFETKLGKIAGTNERLEKIINLYENYPDIAKTFQEDKARKIVSSLFPLEGSREGRGISRCKVADRKD